jgi:SAM-dependent methyltransferase
MKISNTDLNNYIKIRQNVKKFIRDNKHLDSPNKLILEIAPDKYTELKETFTSSQRFTLDIKADNSPDFHTSISANNETLIKSEHFDCVFLLEVIEHVDNPFKAIAEVHRILKTNGTLFLSTPLNFRIHGPLPDNWRFTEHGIREMLKCFSKIEISQIESPKRPLFPIHYCVKATK